MIGRNLPMNKIIRHYGVIGQKWGVTRPQVDRYSGRKAIDYQKEGFAIKKGSELHRITSNANEIEKGSGYASFLKEDSDMYESMGKAFSGLAVTGLSKKTYDTTLLAKKDLISPSQKERVDIFLKKMDDPKFSNELKAHERRMFILNPTQSNDKRMAKEYAGAGLDIKKAKAYRALNLALGSNRSLRDQYLAEFKKLHYDFILDEADSSGGHGGISTAPIIFIERSKSLSIIDIKDL